MSQAVQPHLPWRAATVVQIRPHTPRASTIAMRVPGWPGHLAGQHLDIRLTAEDGYQAQRTYSIASVSDPSTIEITLEEVSGGEVSPFLLRDVVVGDVLELRGPIGGYFTWEPGDGGPLFLVAGGSGIVPLMAIVRERMASGDRTQVRLLYSARSADAIIYRDELEDIVAHNCGVTVTYTLTRAQPEGWTGGRRRIDRAMLAEVGFPVDAQPRAFVCGPTPFVEQAAAHLVALGYPEARIKTERFGPTGEA